MALYGEGLTSAAMLCWHEALRLQPEQVTILTRTAWVLAAAPETSIRSGAEAVVLAQRAVHLTRNQSAECFDCLAAAYAEAGRFAEAVAAADRAMQLLSSAPEGTGQSRSRPVWRRISCDEPGARRSQPGRGRPRRARDCRRIEIGTGMGKQRSARVSTPCIAVLAIAVFAATALLYWPAGDNAFITIDDEDYVVDNPQVLGGLSADGLAWAFTTHHASNWHPLTWLSLQLDATVFGPEARSFHRTKCAAHGDQRGAAAAGPLWATGAGVAECAGGRAVRGPSVARGIGGPGRPMQGRAQRDVFHGGAVGIRAFARCAPSLLGYLAVLLAAVCGLLSKPMLVTLPCVLLLLDYWPLGRFSTAGPTKPGRPAWVGLTVEKIPFFAVAAAAAAITVDAQLDVAIHDLMDYPFQQDLANALASYANYLGQTCWPVNLAVYYPHPCGTITAVQLGGAVLLLGALSGSALWQFRAQPYLAVGWAWFLGMLVPVIGLVQVGVQARADRYTYLPHVGLFVAVAWCADASRHDRVGGLLCARLPRRPRWPFARP